MLAWLTCGGGWLLAKWPSENVSEEMSGSGAIYLLQCNEEMRQLSAKKL